MRISEIMSLVNARQLTCVHPSDSDFGDIDIPCAFASDMMSDVLALANSQTLLITGLINPQAVRTAEMLDISCILYVRSKIPDENVLAMAEEQGITILSTALTMFNTCGILYQAGLSGGMINGK